ncbi:HNH endonuclease [Microbacterium resistens]|uniref:HNH endonuclease n=1 Tax=Microbacterium resistens TaxID=156977 RepID=UPI00366EF52D
MHQLRDEFFEEGKRLDADPATRHLADCWLCRGHIDYTVPQATTPDSHTLDHAKDVETYPELQEDWDNFRHAHFSCNTSRGKRAPNTQGLGEPMPAWWR